jgi:hypothetical protein
MIIDNRVESDHEASATELQLFLLLNMKFCDEYVCTYGCLAHAAELAQGEMATELPGLLGNCA